MRDSRRRPCPTWCRLLVILCYWFAMGTGALLVWSCADQSPQLNLTPALLQLSAHWIR